MTPEEKARQKIDAKLTAVGWVVQDRSAVNLSTKPQRASRLGQSILRQALSDRLISGSPYTGPAKYEEHNQE